jgi:hypothetical protein
MKVNGVVTNLMNRFDGQLILRDRLTVYRFESYTPVFFTLHFVIISWSKTFS